MASNSLFSLVNVFNDNDVDSYENDDDDDENDNDDDDEENDNDDDDDDSNKNRPTAFNKCTMKLPKKYLEPEFQLERRKIADERRQQRQRRQRRLTSTTKKAAFRDFFRQLLFKSWRRWELFSGSNPDFFGRKRKIRLKLISEKKFHWKKKSFSSFLSQKSRKLFGESFIREPLIPKLAASDSECSEQSSELATN